jgi:hypothetical protein
VSDADPFLRRIERTAIAACGAMAVIALALGRGQPRLALAVLAGGALAGLSYWALVRGVHALARARDATASSAARSRPRLAWALSNIVLRYALLAFLAYVMLARFRLHPLGLLAGASSVVAAASVEAFRLLLKKS